MLVPAASRPVTPTLLHALLHENVTRQGSFLEREEDEESDLRD
jgi:hypothetical protein